MSYSKENQKGNSIYYKFKNKLGKLLAQKFPLLSIRILGLKLAGFKIGKKVYIGPELIITSDNTNNLSELSIEDRVAIGPRVTLILSSDANWSNLMLKIKPLKGKITLEKDCWIGAGVIIMPNVKIGSGSIVGAGSIVTKDVAPNTIVCGTPAKFLRTIL